MAEEKEKVESSPDRTDEQPGLSRPEVALLREQDSNFSDDPLSETGEFDTTQIRLLHEASGPTDHEPPAAGTDAADVRRLESDLANLSARWNDVESLLNTLAKRDSETDALRQALAAAEHSAQTATASLEAARAEIAALEDSLSALSERHAQLELAYAEQRTALERARTQRDDAQAALQALDAEGTEVQSRGPQPAAETATETPVRSPVLVQITDERDSRHPIGQPVTTIGRDSDCDIRIVTDFVSRLHAAIVLEGDDYLIEDRDSTNGVFVNSIRVDRAPLRHGDSITLGGARFLYAVEPET